jgi:hypothetical protein
MDDATREKLEAAAFRRLVAHLRKRTDVQNIDLMITGGFCRNCLGDWYAEAAAEQGIALDKESARAEIYGMPQAEWKRPIRKRRRRNKRRLLRLRKRLTARKDSPRCAALCRGCRVRAPESARFSSWQNPASPKISSNPLWTASSG